MATIRFDCRFFTRTEAAERALHIGVTGWRVVPHGKEFRLELETDRVVPVIKQLQRLRPDYTFRVVELDPPKEMPE